MQAVQQLVVAGAVALGRLAHVRVPMPLPDEPREHNQYADRVGIELPYLSVLCERAAQGGDAGAGACAGFAAAHPLPWVGELQDRVEAAASGGYHARILALAAAILSGALRFE